MSYKPITNITIAHVPNDRAVIALLLLEYLQICKPRKICVMPDFKRNKLCYTAYIEVAEWCDRETAYNLIRKIKDPRREARIIYEDDNWWTVEESLKDELCFTSSPDFMPWTTVFKEPAPEEEEPEEKKQVRFKRGLEIETTMTIEDIDMRMECKNPNLDFDAFCKGFGLYHGFDFEAEFDAWTEEQIIEAAEKALAKVEEAKETVIEMGF